MKKFAVIENGIVINLIIADSKEVAEILTLKECIESNEENNLGVGSHWSNDYNRYIPPSPFLSWVFDGQNWIPPVQYPEDSKNYFWDEESISWIEA